jgi:lysophospholipase
MPAAVLSAESRFDRRRHPDGLAFDVRRAADGWPLRAYRWPSDATPPRGSLLFQSGRADFIEKYLEACDHWHGAGWAIEGFDWRGQGGSRRSDAESGAGRIAEARFSFDPMIDDLVAFARDWQARTPAPHVIVAHSMGGYLALRACADRGLAPDALILVAPMIALNTRRLPRWIARSLIALAVAAGWGARPAWNEDHSDPRRQSRLTASRERYEDSQWWKRRTPTLAMGAPTWSWLAAALAAGRGIARRGLIERVRIPVLLIEAGLDALVDAAAIERTAARLADAELVRLPGARHEILRDADAPRLAALAAIDAFLDRRAPVR